MAQMPEIGAKKYAGNDPAMKQVWNYIYQLEEQLRYAFNHIGADNIEEGAVTGKHIEAETITADRLSASAGNDLNITGNRAVLLTAKKQSEADGKISQLRVDTDAIAGRVSDAEGNISQIRQTAEGLESRVTSAETSITQNAEQIALRATKTEVTSAVDGIQVGGTNLIPGTADWKYTITSTTPASRVQKQVWLYKPGEAALLTGKTITMSYTIKNAGAGEAYSDAPSYGLNRFGGYMTASWIDSTGNISGIKDTFPLATYVGDKGDLRRAQYTVTPTPPAGYDTLYSLRFTMELNCHPTDEGNAWIFERPKVELGNKATDWSPAPQDAENRISTAETQIAQNATEISLRATKTEMEGLQIGGTNLFTGTRNFSGDAWINKDAWSEDAEYKGFSVLIKDSIY